ncbi:MAG: excinuclease ABC subunit UvrC [Parvibaculum sp.]
MSEPNSMTDSPLQGSDLIAAKVKTLPDSPGVYRMMNAKGEVLYVGKARSLKKRVSSYTKLLGHSNRIARMISSTTDMEFITTATETDALLLEANLIKQLKPRYNVLLRDDKSFPYILLTGNHDFPQVLKHRGARSQKGDYFGPFASAGSVTRTLNTLQRAFLLRSCSDSVFENRTRPCLLFQIKRCSAPCTGEVTKAAYQELVVEAHDFLRGKSRKTQEHLLHLMEEASTKLDFEGAALYRDRIRALTQIQSHQGINPQSVTDADVFAVADDSGQTCVQVFFFRGGQNWGNRAYFPRHDKDVTRAEVLDAFLAQFYDERPAPSHLMLSEQVEGRALLAEALTIRGERKVSVSVPQRGEKRELVEHALRNATDALARRLAESATQRKLLSEMVALFDLESSPQRIEIYDNSHIQGTNQVGGMVVAGPEGFLKNQYRKFNIKEGDVEPGDDYGMMRQVLTRRFSRLLKESASADENADQPGSDQNSSPSAEDALDARRALGWPDIILIDGGQGQLSVTMEVMRDLGITDVTVISIAKGPDRNAGRERFFMPGRPPFSLPEKSPVLFYLQRLRDEAHRFAIGSHRARRAKQAHENPLDQVPGVGASRKRALLHHFGSAKAVSRAGLSDLQSVEGISEKVALAVYNHFHGNPD